MHFLKSEHKIDDSLAVDSGELAGYTRGLAFVAVHLMCLGVIWVGWSWVAVSVAAALYLIRMFAITGFYHRYFSHRTFKTSRWFQFIFAVVGSSAVQKGPLWWAAHHRHHHGHSDTEEDVHSPIRKGFFYSHIGWIYKPKNGDTRKRLVPDLSPYPELRFLNRFDALVPTLLGVATFFLGVAINALRPDWGTNGMQMLIWGFFISTVVLFHGTAAINSFAHLFGRRRFDTNDHSRNSFLLALLTLGEGWHNNHHRYPAATRQGFYWWEVDITYMGLFLMSKLGLIWDLKPVPAPVLASGLYTTKTTATR
jgi:stearoyl-CoA desaturase (delta-9 desaturase)